MHKIWCLSSDSVTHEFHPTAQIDVVAETVGQFSAQYFSENGRRFTLIGQISINGSVKLLGISADAWVCRFPFVDNVLAPTVIHSWGDNDISNQNWLVIPGGTYITLQLRGEVSYLTVLLTCPGV